MIVVSNTSPIFYLSTIGQLDLLRPLYAEIVIPTKVFNEITNVGNTDASARVVPTLSWIKTQPATEANKSGTLAGARSTDFSRRTLTLALVQMPDVAMVSYSGVA